MKYAPLAQSATIVIVGNLNPAIFSPAWLALNDVIDNAEMEAAQVAVIHPEICEFAIDTLRLQVTPTRMQIETTEVPFVRIADLIVDVFGRLLKHTPVAKLGINFGMHFSVEDAKRRVALGRALAPLEPWGEWGKSLDAPKLFNVGGLRSVIMEQRTVEGRREGSYRRAHVEPSLLKSPPSSTDVFMYINDHFELPEAPGTETLVATLVENFDPSIMKANEIIGDVMEFAARLT